MEPKEGKKRGKKLTYKQELFCQLYIAYHQNGTRAYIEAYGVKESTARTNASRLLTNANIKERISELYKMKLEEIGVTALRVLQEKAGIAYASKEDLYEMRGGELKLKKDIDIKNLRYVKKIKENTNLFGTTYEIEMFDKQKALNDLSDYLGLNQEKDEGEKESDYRGLWEGFKNVQEVAKKAFNELQVGDKQGNSGIEE